ncbi:YegS/Rv2252/BmrU family lipid kinase [Clostridium senegalense]|uniref:YegS/Rv2252/BmrU family lipid kinase n=1 Tax=Clostridium senegalense TaxID=1465809 RepID=A0A6M0H0P3_9CLOT|nr:YegS/Rv2252/BmrU family lipid kinase [Clostridium senegalense]NEU03778.1 YegS/Rv2252/BmrU family lipid kinase [Clostridium senegalense]
MKKVKFIYNPYSGENSILEELDTVIRIHQQYGFVVEPYRIEREEPISQAFANIDESFEYILIAGGDGTIDSVVNQIKKRDIDLPIGVLPVGTANDFAKNIVGMPEDVEKSLHQILNSKEKYLDLGKVNEKYFVNVASTGIFTDVSQKTDLHLKNTMGKMAYYIKGLEEIPNIRKLGVKVESSNVTFDGTMYLMLIFNGKTAGNLRLAQSSEADDGLLDVIIIKSDIMKNALNNLLIMLKKRGIYEMDGVMCFKTDELTVHCEEDIATDIDGEPGPQFPLRITCEKKAIKVLGYIYEI